MKTHTVLIFSYVTAIAATALSYLKHITIYFDQTYIDSLNLPADGDSLGIPLFGSIILGLGTIFAVSAVYAIALAALWRKKSLRTTTTLHSITPRLRQPIRSILKLLIFANLLLWMTYSYPPATATYQNISPIYIITDALATLAAIIATLTLCAVIGQSTALPRKGTPRLSAA